MALYCFKCSEVFRDVSSLTKHFRLRHAYLEGGVTNLKCGNLECPRRFTTMSGFRKHMKKCITVNKPSPVVANNTEYVSDNIASGIENTQFSNEHQCSDFTVVNNEQKLDDDVHLVESCLHNITLELKKNNVPNGITQKIFNYFSEVIEITSQTTASFENSSTCSSCNYSVKFFNRFKQSLSAYSTTYKRNKSFANTIVHPREISVGIRKERVFNKSIGKYIETNVASKFMYIPFLETLKLLLLNQEFRNLLNKSKEKNKDLYKDLNDGSLFLKNGLFRRHPNALQIQLYYDEFETTNPLGSKTGSHKMGALYFLIRNLPPFCNSKLCNIHLLALFYSQDLKNIDFNAILKPIVDDLKILEDEGITIEVDSCSQVYYGSLCALSFDNLGGNVLFGLVESFSANNFCRLCLINKNDIQDVLEEENHSIVMRNDLNYEKHAKNASQENIVYGVKRRSILNDLRYFKLCDVPSVDIMHDILEGTGQKALKLFAQFLISNKYCSLEQLNNRIVVFNYGIIGKKDTPSPIALDKPGHLLGQRAAQTWLLLRFFPLIVQDYLTDEIIINKFKVVVSLLKCVNIIFAPVISECSVSNLRVLIGEHLTHLKQQFNCKLIPKHHFLIHYPNIIRKMGPLIYLWSMRFEAKHNFFKNTCKKLNSFKNVAKTLALNHQQYVSLNWGDDSLAVQVSYSPVKSIPLHSFLYQEIVHENLSIPDDIIVNVFKWVHMGFDYRIGYMICSGFQLDNMPLFEEIIAIITFENSDAFLITKPWSTLQFNDSTNAYLLRPQNVNLSLINLTSLVYREPYELVQGCDCNTLEMYLVPKHIFEQQ